MLADKLAVASLVVVELKAGNALDQGFQKRLALEERQTGGVAAVQMQKIENVVDEPNPSLAIASSLGLGKAGQTVVANAAQFAVEISGLNAQLRESGHDVRIRSLQSSPVRVSNCTRPRSMRAAMRKPSSLISWSHWGPDGAISTGWQSWGGIQRGSGEGASCRARDALVLIASAAERFTTRAMNGNSRCRTRTLSPHSLTQINARMPQIADAANVRSQGNLQDVTDAG